ncbi:hypothetical protein HHI36_013204 [Cryptolaemus montrouzieri]|uniref:Uncharacterized protein n=1 Tax=Cryptolaemus montrouzieri TaxID=559131 RepID=A0ABD2NGG4_9CUCU
MRKGSNITRKSLINDKYPKQAQQNQFKIFILHQNVQSIGNAIDQLQSVIRDVPKENELNVICGTEYWKTKDQLKNYGIDGCCLASYYCRDINEHGGSAIYVRNGISCKENPNS